MKKSYLNIILWANGLIQLLYWIAFAAVRVQGMYFRWTGSAYPVFAVLSSALAVWAAGRRRDETASAAAIWTLPAAILQAISLILFWKVREGGIIGILIVICAAAAFFLGKKRKAMRAAAGVLSVSLAGVLGVILFLSACMGDFGKNTVERCLPSPDGKWFAEVIDADQGALGGDTLVRVRRHTFLDGVCEVGKNAFVGEWGLSDALNVEWTEDNRLIIDGKNAEF